jgi:hypothetical protein
MSKHTLYAGRAEIGGKHLVLDQYATLRGTIRRSDADGNTNTAPYFPGLAADDTLIVFVEGAANPVTVQITAADLVTVLADLNNQLNDHNVRAYDDGGCIALQILLDQAITGSEFLEVRGGTGAAALGFDLAFGVLRAWPGGVTGGPEGRVGNGELSAFLNLGEGLSSRAINRSLTRVATNADQHQASLATPKIKIEEIGTLAGVTQTTIGNYGILQISRVTPIGIYTGYNWFNANSSADTLAPFFGLIDGNTNRTSTSRVVAVGVNSVTGSPPYVDAALTTDIGNALGVSLRREGAFTILDIPEGNRVRAALGSFSNVKVGDLAFISPGAGAPPKAATNNARNPWVVEAVGSDGSYDQVKVRCLSQEEWFDAGGSHPVVITSLDTQYEASELFGLIRFETGFFTDSNLLRIVVSPPISQGTTLRLFAGTRSPFPIIGEALTNLFPVSKGLFDEVARALAAETAIDGRVTTEVSRAMAAESVLRAADLSSGQKTTLTTGVNADSLHTHTNTGAPVAHTHVEGDVTDLVSHLAGKAPTSHLHNQSDITSLVAMMNVLAGGPTINADSYHTHALGGGGTPGAAGTMTVGTVTTSAPGGAASITNVGTSTAAILNFVLPRGDTGPQGSQGPAGPQQVTGRAYAFASGSGWGLSSETPGMSSNSSGYAGYGPTVEFPADTYVAIAIAADGFMFPISATRNSLRSWTFTTYNADTYNPGFPTAIWVIGFA